MANVGFTLWFTGLSGAGKSTLAEIIKQRLREYGHNVEVLDGNEVRTHLSRGLGFSKEDRDTNIKRIAFVAKLLTRNGVITISAAIAPYHEARTWAREEINHFVEIYVKCPLEVCRQRDVTGLYKLADEGKIKNFTVYEEPEAPEVIVETDKESIEESVQKIFAKLKELGYLVAEEDSKVKANRLAARGERWKLIVTILGVLAALLLAGWYRPANSSSIWSMDHCIHYITIYTPIGIIVGFLIGMTGMGGGSLLTPILILVTGTGTLGAVASDFMYAAITKAFGSWEHFRLKQIDIGVACWLAAGSMPATFVTTLVVGRSKHNGFVGHALGIMLLVAAILFLLKPYIMRHRRRETAEGVAAQPNKLRNWLRRISTTLLGAGVGIVVGLTSVGSGTLIFLSIAFLYPKIEARKLVGTDIFQALLMLAAGSVSYLSTGAIDVNLVGALLVGSLPVVQIGAKASQKAPIRLLTIVLAVVLGLSGYLLLTKHS